jgi:polygalacturonase
VLRASGESASLNVRSLGAKGDGKTKDTTAIQAAIDAAGRAGGTVSFPPGDYVSGTLHLRNRSALRLAAGATLIASPDNADFDAYERPDYDSFADRETTDFTFALLQGQTLEHVSILGPGRIDGNRASRGGPKPIALKQCRHIAIRDLRIDNAPNYNISLLGCDGVDIVGVTIRNGYSDGIDPDCCRNVRIARCRIESRDDAIVAKASLALGARQSMENLVVTDCALVKVRNALKLGTESVGDFKNIVFRNCTISGRTDPRTNLHEWKPFPSAGISIEAVDGGTLEHVVVSGITMAGIRAPIFVRLGNRGRGQDVPAPGALKGIWISNIVATGARWPSSIMGIPGHPVSDISLKDIRIAGKGGGNAEMVSREVPELENEYPDASKFRDLPAYGLYCRHVTRLSLERIELTVGEPDARPAVILDDVSEPELRTIVATAPPDGGPVVWLR